MIQVLYEYPQPWPDNGALNLDFQPPALEISVPPDLARRSVNSYLVTYVSMTLYAADPILILHDQKPFWRVAMNMRLPDFGYISTLGHIKVDAQTREVEALTEEQIRQIQDQANAIIRLVTPQAN